MSGPEEIAYDRGAFSARDLQQAVRDFFSEMDGDERIQQDAASAGIDLLGVRALGEPAIEVTSRRPGLTGVEEVIVVAIATELTAGVWRDVILPSLKRRFGGNVVGEERKDPS